MSKRTSIIKTMIIAGGILIGLALIIAFVVWSKETKTASVTTALSSVEQQICSDPAVGYPAGTTTTLVRYENNTGEVGGYARDLELDGDNYLDGILYDANGKFIVIQTTSPSGVIDENSFMSAYMSPSVKTHEELVRQASDWIVRIKQSYPIEVRLECPKQNLVS